MQTGHESLQICRRTGSVCFKNDEYTKFSNERPRSTSLFGGVTAVGWCNSIDFKGVISSSCPGVDTRLTKKQGANFSHDRTISYFSVSKKGSRDLDAQLFINSLHMLLTAKSLSHREGSHPHRDMAPVGGRRCWLEMEKLCAQLKYLWKGNWERSLGTAVCTPRLGWNSVCEGVQTVANGSLLVHWSDLDCWGTQILPNLLFILHCHVLWYKIFWKYLETLFEV